jgi:uncharacterized protein (TIGR03067 family)
MRKSVLLLLGAIFSLAFAPAPLPKPDRGKDDLKRMQGTWELVSFKVRDQPQTTGVHRAVIAGERMTYYDKSGKLWSEWWLSLDVTKAPRRFVWKKGGSTGPVKFRGAYVLGKDELTIYYSDVDSPADFEGGKLGRCREAFRRVKR